jgi:hypothetical protein
MRDAYELFLDALCNLRTDVTKTLFRRVSVNFFYEIDRHLFKELGEVRSRLRARLRFVYSKKTDHFIDWFFRSRLWFAFDQ